jgi:uncharacterized protein (DUF488 family)
MEQKSAIFTIGYQDYSLLGLVNILKEQGIDTLVDVRYDAYSKRPEFCKGRLRSAIEEAGMEYIHRPELGTPTQLRKKITNAGSGQEVFRLYFERISKVNYRYVEAVAELASPRKLVLMCMEKEPERCHRKILADFLSRKFGFEVVHLAPPPKSKLPKETSQLTFDL